MKSLLGVFLVLALVLAACAPAPMATEAPPAATEMPPTAIPPTEMPAETEAPVIPDTSAQTIVDLAVADGRFTTLVGALTSADLVETLAGEGPFTVFAPTDDAFAALPAGTLESLTPEQLTEILLYHVVSGNVSSEQAAQLDSAETLAGKSVQIRAENGAVMINDAEVIAADVEASNGVIHVIDQVLLPPSEEAMAEDEMAMPEMDLVETAIADGRFTTLVAAVEAAGLVETLQSEGPFTVFAPTDDAFAVLGEETIAGLLETPDELANILLYHVVPGKVMAADVLELNGALVDTALEGAPVAISIAGEEVKVNDALVIITDVEASNGVIHVLDAVLLPPSQNLVEAAEANGFTTLLAAVEAAGLTETLQGAGPFTVFAPTDEAFAALGEDTINALLQDPDQLAQILLYHVIPAKVSAADAIALDGSAVDTALEGAQISIQFEDGMVILNDNVQVIVTNVVTTNGVIHVIDGVLMPPQ